MAAILSRPQCVNSMMQGDASVNWAITSFGNGLMPYFNILTAFSGMGIGIIKLTFYALNFSEGT